MPRISRAFPLPLFALIALFPLGCGTEKKEAAKADEKQESVASGAKVTESVPITPVEIAKLPVDSNEAAHLGTLGFAVNHGSHLTDAARTVAIDSDGNYLVAGYFRGPNIFGSDFKMEDTHPDAFLAKLRKKDGSAIWSVSLGGKSADISEAIAIGPDGSTVVVGAMSEDLNVGDGVLTSSGADDIFLAKFAADGRRLWVKQIGGADVDAAHSVVIDSAGNAYITGVFRYKVDFDSDLERTAKGNGDIFLSKVSPTGEFLWTKTYGAVDDDFGRDLALDSKGNIILLAEISGRVNFGGHALTTNGNRDLALVKLDSDGGHIWSKSMGNHYDDIGISLTVDPADNIIFTGSFEGTINLGGNDLPSAGKADLFVAKFDANGGHIWSRGFGGKDNDWGNSVASDAYGNSFIAGWFRYDIDIDGTKLTSKGEQDALLVKLDPNGAVLWAKSFGNKSLDMAKAVEVNADGSIVAVGAFNVSIDFGSGAMTPNTNEGGKVQAGDFWLATFAR